MIVLVCLNPFSPIWDFLDFCVPLSLMLSPAHPGGLFDFRLWILDTSRDPIHYSSMRVWNIYGYSKTPKGIVNWTTHPFFRRGVWGWAGGRPAGPPPGPPPAHPGGPGRPTPGPPGWSGTVTTLKVGVTGFGAPRKNNSHDPILPKLDLWCVLVKF